jgi:hypothetical protein
MAGIASDDDFVLQSEGESEEELQTINTMLECIHRQCRQVAQACSMMTELLDDDDERMGDQQAGDYIVDLGNMISGHESRFF